jgi:hypothetical protein
MKQGIHYFEIKNILSAEDLAYFIIFDLNKQDLCRYRNHNPSKIINNTLQL